MELPMQITSNDQNVGSDTVQDLIEFNSQSLATQAKKGEQLVSMLPAFKKAFNLMGDDIFDLSTENEILKNYIGDYDEKRLEQSKAELLKQIDDDERANLIMPRMQKRIKSIEKLAFITYNKLWESEFDNFLSKYDKVQDLNFNQLKLEVHDTYEKDQKITTELAPTDDSDAINKA